MPVAERIQTSMLLSYMDFVTKNELARKLRLYGRNPDYNPRDLRTLMVALQRG
jgi:hypothetical protein